MPDSPGVTTFLFTDIEGSTRLWEREPERMHAALAQHDAIARASVEQHRGTVVKTIGDGVHAVFADPLDALRATLQLQQALAEPAATNGVALRVRCGLHAGVDIRRDNDYYGNAVNRAARIMSTAHGGQILLSQTVTDLVAGRLPREVSLRDLGAVRLRDLTQPEHVYQVIHPALRQDFPALRSLEATPNNLPQQLTSFIGREHELAEVRRQLRQARLLTLVGVGGLGKSRLSLQVAAEALDAYPDGVWFVELAPVTDSRLVPQAVASVLGVKEDAGRPVLDALLKFIHDRRLLVVLDNCEHLAQACADLARKLLEAAPHVTILATSRERLNIAGEKAYPLAPFPVPLPQQRLTPEALAQFASVRLFCERAASAQPDFEITVDNAGAVAEICHRLDGIPLALELAAARVRAMSVDKIRERLTDRFKLLSGGDRTALPRQQTLRALIDWSYDLLDPSEQLLFRRLAVFAGGFTLEAAEKVGAGEAIQESDVLDLVTQLVEKSLVALDVERDRYGMLETVRQYAEERLRDASEEVAARERHLAYYLGFAETARPMLFGPSQGSWLRKLDLERENLLAAHACCNNADNGAERGLRLVLLTKAYWMNRGLLRLGHRITREALARSGADVRNLARCRGLFDLGQIAILMGNHTDAQAFLEESLDIARELGDRGRIAAVLQPLGMTHVAHGNLQAARSYLEEALFLARELAKKREIAAALTALAMLNRLEGKLDTAEPLYREVLALSRELEDRASIAISLLNLAIVAISSNRSVDARPMLREVTGIALEIESKPIGQSVLEVAAGLMGRDCRWELTARLFGAAEALAQHTGVQRDAADAQFLMPHIEQAREALGAARFDAAEQEGRTLTHENALEEVRAALEDP